MVQNRHYALAREAILRSLVAYTGITTADGATPANNTLICNALIGSNDYISNKAILILSGNSRGEDSGASGFVAGSGTITVVSPFNSQILAGTLFMVLNISSIEIDVAAINTKIGTNGDAAGTTTLFAWMANLLAAFGGATGIFHEQVDTPVDITAILAAETNVLNLAVANTRYIVRSLRLKAANPNPNTIAVRLYELVNDVATVVDTFTIDNANFGTYFSLMDMFGLPHLVGDNLRVTVQASAGGPYAVTGQYSHGKTNV